MRLPVFSAYQSARLLSTSAAALEQCFLSVSPPRGFGEAYRSPGQFVKIRIDGLEGIFAMYSAPREDEVRFLVRTENREGGEAAEALAAAADGTEIEMTLPAGRGFDLGAARGGDIRFLATGTGVAPVRAAIEHVLSDRAGFGRLSLDHGLRSPRHLAIGDEIERWRRLDVDVAVHYSTVDDETGRIAGSTVQDGLRSRGALRDSEYVLAVGQDEMLADVRRIVLTLGGTEARVLVNV